MHGGDTYAFLQELPLASGGVGQIPVEDSGKKEQVEDEERKERNSSHGSINFSFYVIFRSVRREEGVNKRGDREGLLYMLVMVGLVFGNTCKKMVYKKVIPLSDFLSMKFHSYTLCNL